MDQPKKRAQPLRYWCSTCYADRGRPCLNSAGRPLPEGAVHPGRMAMAQEMAKLYHQGADG